MDLKSGLFLALEKTWIAYWYSFSFYFSDKNRSGIRFSFLLFVAGVIDAFLWNHFLPATSYCVTGIILNAITNLVAIALLFRCKTLNPYASLIGISILEIISFIARFNMRT